MKDFCLIAILIYSLWSALNLSVIKDYEKKQTEYLKEISLALKHTDTKQ